MNALSFLLPFMKSPLFPQMTWSLLMLLGYAVLFTCAFKKCVIYWAEASLVFLPTFWGGGVPIWCHKIEKEGGSSDYPNKLLFPTGYFNSKGNLYHFIECSGFICQGKWWVDFHVHMNV
jgi:hypothetical protein